MNTISRITLAAAVAGALTITNTASAQVFRSPKLADQQIRTAPATGDPDLAHPAPPKVFWSPRAASNRTVVVRRKATDPDLAHSAGFFVGGSTHAREIYARQVQTPGLKDVELAPLK